MSRRYDEIFGDIVTILRRDYAGRERMGERFDPRYYNTAVGQAWHDGKLDELLFYRYMCQMLACVGDRHLRIVLAPSEGYAPGSRGFQVRRHGDALYVTAVTAEPRLAPGDRITAVNGASPGEHRTCIQKNFFFSDDPEREDWGGFLKMADTIDVEHPDGSREQLALKTYPPEQDPAPGPALYQEPEGAILDLRNRAEVADAELEALLPLLCRRDTPLKELLDTAFFVNYTPLNCALRAAGLEGLDGAEDYLLELKEKAGQGFLPETDDNDRVIPCHAPARVVVLTDTWTRDGAETLALAARRAGVCLMGRPTLGTTDFGGDVSLSLDERYTFTWPTLITRDAREGRGLTGRGVEPDILLPWTPEECRRDLLWEAAMEWIKENK